MDRLEGGEAMTTSKVMTTVGNLVRDRVLDRVGVVMELHAGWVYLRPLGGGIEWTALPDQLENASRQDELRARVGELNQHSSDRRYW